MGLNFWNERLWFNTPDTVYSMNIDGTDLKTEYTYDTAENDKFIYSFLADDGVLSLSLVDISGEVTEQQVKLEGVAYHVHSYESVWVDATCTQEGYRQNTCPCGVTYHTDQTDPLDHELALEALEGRVRHYCLNCGYGWEETVTTTEPMPTEPALTQSPEVSAEEMSLPIPAFLGAAVIAAGVLLLRSSRKKRRT